MARLSATYVARRFSEVLSRVAAGEEIEVTRAGVSVALIAPSKIRLLAATPFRELLNSAPPVDRDFADEVRAIRAEVGPPESR